VRVHSPVNCSARIPISPLPWIVICESWWNAFFNPRLQRRRNLCWRQWMKSNWKTCNRRLTLSPSVVSLNVSINFEREHSIKRKKLAFKTAQRNSWSTRWEWGRDLLRRPCLEWRVRVHHRKDQGKGKSSNRNSSRRHRFNWFENVDQTTSDDSHWFNFRDLIYSSFFPLPYMCMYMDPL